jgi:NAD(P)-dependent dehydrogenase (short-subunit alcohol dehydrogenase family)
MTVDLEGKRCVVTGASVGIGRALAIAYASRGAAVDLIARSRGALEETAHLVQAAGGSAAVHVTDLTDVAAIEELATGLSAFGEMFVIANVASAWHDAGRAFHGRLLFETPTAEICESWTSASARRWFSRHGSCLG